MQQRVRPARNSNTLTHNATHVRGNINIVAWLLFFATVHVMTEKPENGACIMLTVILLPLILKVPVSRSASAGLSGGIWIIMKYKFWWNVIWKWRLATCLRGAIVWVAIAVSVVVLTRMGKGECWLGNQMAFVQLNLVLTRSKLVSDELLYWTPWLINGNYQVSWTGFCFIVIETEINKVVDIFCVRLHRRLRLVLRPRADGVVLEALKVLTADYVSVGER